MNSSNTSRRTFIKTTAAAAAIGGIIPSTVLGANDRINIGIIGTGGMGTGHLKGLVERTEEDNIRVPAVCDVYQRRLSQAMDICKGDGYMDYRKVLDRSDIDMVLIATPDHWHSKICIDAMEAGKHVYCEKPLTLTAEQAIEVRNAVRRYGKKLQVGPQRTSQDKYRNARKVIGDGRIGEVSWAHGSWNRNERGSGAFGTSGDLNGAVGPQMTGEDYIDWDMWLGHQWGLAQKIPFSPRRFFYFRGFFDYNGGVATDLLYHFLAPLLLSIVGENGAYPRRVTGNGGLYLNKDGREVPDVFVMTIDYPKDFTITLESVLTNEFARPTRIYGRYGTIETTELDEDFKMIGCGNYMDRFMEKNEGYEKLTIHSEKVGGSPKDMEKNLFAAIRTGEKLFCNVDLGASTMVAIKMGVESYRRSKTLLWDAEKEQIVES